MIQRDCILRLFGRLTKEACKIKASLSPSMSLVNLVNPVSKAEVKPKTLTISMVAGKYSGAQGK